MNVDPADRSTWPEQVRAATERLVSRCMAQPDNTPETRADDLSLDRDGDERFPDYSADHQFRQLFDSHLLLLNHATRLLPHERERLQLDGLLALTRESRDERLDRVIEHYGTHIGADALKRSGPLYWPGNRADVRVARLYGVTPLHNAFHDEASGLTDYLSRWGGESISWARDDGPDLAHTLDQLTELSAPTIIEVALDPRTLNTAGKLWPIFAAQLAGWTRPWQEFFITENIPPERIVAIIDETSERWPARPRVAT